MVSHSISKEHYLSAMHDELSFPCIIAAAVAVVYIEEEEILIQW